jgi:flavin reductase (DIM6/NTAB) family NADH-FMN oxidoreductase RutF
MLNPQPLVCTTPTVLVGAVVADSSSADASSEGKANFMAVAWCGVACSNPPMVSVAIRPQRHTFKGIIATREFSVNVPSTDQVKEADYCGMVSGANVDKTAVCKFNIFYGSLKSAPLIEQCPVNLACKVEHILELGTHQLVIGRVVETHVTDSCLNDGRPDMRKIRPFVYGATVPSEYYAFGEVVGRAFGAGRGVGGK